MVDYSINSDFDIHFTEWGDFAVVDGLEEFEQDVVIRLHENQKSIYRDEAGRKIEREKIRLSVTRVAKEFDVIDSIENISITEVQAADKSYQVEVTYKTGDIFTEEI